MTRKDYVTIAGAIKDALGDQNLTSQTKGGIVAVICGHLKAENAAFKPEKFRAACGL